MSEHTERLRREAERKERAKERRREQELASFSHRRKLAWAQTHIQKVKHLAEAWVTDKEAYEVKVEPDGQGGSELIGRQLKALPDELGLVVGDALQSMRSALDNLAFSLAIKHTPKLTPNQQKGVSFPIFDRPPQPGHKSIEHMDPAVIKKIIAMSPDKTVGPLEQHPLWLLDKTNNRDKHRVITVVASAVTNLNQTFSGLVLGDKTRIGAGSPQRTQNIGDRVVFSTFGPGTKFKIDATATIQIVFGDRIEAADLEVFQALSWFHGYIEKVVLKRLEPHL